MRVFGTVHAEPSDSVDAPAYRVNFWERPSDATAWELDAYVLTDVAEALLWVEDNARGRRVELFAETQVRPVGAFEEPRSAGLVRLLGDDPNVGPRGEVWRFRQST